MENHENLNDDLEFNRQQEYRTIFYGNDINVVKAEDLYASIDCFDEEEQAMCINISSL